jgi:hypothetical protein
MLTIVIRTRRKSVENFAGSKFSIRPPCVILRIHVTFMPLIMYTKQVFRLTNAKCPGMLFLYGNYVNQLILTNV